MRVRSIAHLAHLRKEKRGGERKKGGGRNEEEERGRVSGNKGNQRRGKGEEKEKKGSGDLQKPLQVIVVAVFVRCEVPLFC